MAKPTRTLSRVCVAVGSAAKYRENRLRGYYATESHVPLVKDYLEACARVYKIDLNKKVTITREEDRDLWWKLQNGPYPYTPRDDGQLLERVCYDLSMTQREVEAMCASLRKANTVDDLKKIKIPIQSEEKLSKDRYDRR